MKKFFLSVAFLFISLLSSAQNSAQHNSDISKYLELFNQLYVELDLNYVDSLDVKKNIEGAIRYMLHQIDPYTTYYGENEGEDLKLMATGKYAGVGALIAYSKRADRCIISEPYEHMPAAKAGLRRGDVIYEIDGKPIDKRGATETSEYTSKISDTMRGEPGTSIEIKVKRVGSDSLLTFKMERSTITLPTITYDGIVADSIGYILLNGYVENTARELKSSIKRLKEQGAKSIILDLRDNGGGVMVEAVNIVNLFLPQGLEVVSTKGKTESNNYTMRTTEKPFDTEIPIVALTNGATASAAEITCGALQDYDRGVVMGGRTYGKGLVQQPRQLTEEAFVKLTVSKYYIPSGRCVQAYKYENGEPKHLPDSVSKVFHTKGGRPVRDCGGITPDILLEQDSLPNLLGYLLLSDELTEYVATYRLKHETIASPAEFRLTNEEYAEFCNFLKEKEFTYDRNSSEVLDLLRRVTKSEGYAEAAKAEFEALEKKLAHNIDFDLKTWEKEIRELVESSIIADYYYHRGGTEYQLRYDKDVKAAIELLKDRPRYLQILHPKKKS